MSEHDPNLTSEQIDRAVAQRLAKLRNMPVDASRLSKLVEAQIPRSAKEEPSRLRLAAWIRPMRAVAASLLVMGLIAAIIISSSSGPAMASTQDLLKVHQEVVAGKVHSMPVQSIDGANRALTHEWPNAPRLPEVPHDQVMSCCVHRMGRQKIACAAMKIGGVPVSMAVADASDIQMPPGPTIQRDGVSYRVDSANGVNMVMTQRNGRWACLMGAVPTQDLLRAFDGLKW